MGMTNSYTYCDYNDDYSESEVHGDKYGFPRHCGAQGPRIAVDFGATGHSFELLTGGTRSEELLELRDFDLVGRGTLDISSACIVKAYYDPEPDAATYFRIELLHGDIVPIFVVLTHA